MSNKRNIALSVLILLSLIGTIGTSKAAVDLPWSQSYVGCNDWYGYSTGDPTGCTVSGLQKWSVQKAGGIQEEEIISAANNPSGLGGKGQRHYLGCTATTCFNSLSGGTVVNINNAPHEIWMRWYMRFQNGFYAGSNGLEHFKVFFIDANNDDGHGIRNVPCDFNNYNNKLRGLTYATTPTVYGYTNGIGFLTINGGAYGDGNFHAYEFHIKLDTNGADGVYELWIDGNQKIDNHSTNLVGGQADKYIHYIIIGSNAGYIDCGTPPCYWYVDFDDIVISTTGYIGLVNASSSNNTFNQSVYNTGWQTILVNSTQTTTSFKNVMNSSNVKWISLWDNILQKWNVFKSGLSYNSNTNVTSGKAVYMKFTNNDTVVRNNAS